jgi:hypothetical protein
MAEPPISVFEVKAVQLSSIVDDVVLAVTSDIVQVPYGVDSIVDPIELIDE